MQVQSINAMGNLYSSNCQQGTKSKKTNNMPSFKSLGFDGERILEASREQLRHMAEQARTLPEKDRRELTRVYGFLHVKRGQSGEAYGRLQTAIDEVNAEIAQLRRDGSPEAKARLNELCDIAAKGSQDYYKEDPPSDGPDRSLDEMVADIHSQV